MLLQADIANLKSNMDRFIGVSNGDECSIIIDLKSNMDRFIACGFVLLDKLEQNLKSNMDRFIEFRVPAKQNLFLTFKIQYG